MKNLTQISIFALIIFFLCIPPAKSATYRVSPGTDQIGMVLPKLVAGDSICLSEVGTYHETISLNLPDIPLTILGDPSLPTRPVITSEADAIIRIGGDITISGILFDGRDQTNHGIRSNAPFPNLLIVENCEFANFANDVITAVRRPLEGCIIRNSLFHDLGSSAIEFRTLDMCRYLQVTNSTFYNIGELAIRVVRRNVPVQVHINNVTIHNALGGIYLIRVPNATVTNNIISGCKAFGIRVGQEQNLWDTRNNLTFANRRNYDVELEPTCCPSVDPLFFSPESGDFSLLPQSPALTAGTNQTPIGDLRWTGEASQKAGRLRLLQTWGFSGGISLGIIGFIFGIYRIGQYQTRKQESQRALEKAKIELERRVVERTKELSKTNEQLRAQIKERERAESELADQQTRTIHADRLRSLGEMAAGIAHELNQPLVGVRGLAEHTLIGQTKGWALSDKQLTDRMKLIVEQADRMVHIIQHVRLFAREAGKPNTEPTDINHVVHSAMDMLGAQFRSRGIELGADLTDNLPPIQVNPYTLEEVLLNLLNNARDAVESKSGTREDFLPDVHIRTYAATSDKDQSSVCVEIKDNGTGIPLETLKNIFNPFFTTKDPDKGTGLGLSISKGIVEEFDGELSVSTHPPNGTIFTITLPAIQQAPVEKEAVAHLV